MLLAQDIKDINGVLVLALLHTSVLFSELLVLESSSKLLLHLKLPHMHSECALLQLVDCNHKPSMLLNDWLRDSSSFLKNRLNQELLNYPKTLLEL